MCPIGPYWGKKEEEADSQNEQPGSREKGASAGARQGKSGHVLRSYKKEGFPRPARHGRKLFFSPGGGGGTSAEGSP